MDSQRVWSMRTMYLNGVFQLWDPLIPYSEFQFFYISDVNLKFGFLIFLWIFPPFFFLRILLKSVRFSDFDKGISIMWRNFNIAYWFCYQGLWVFVLGAIKIESWLVLVLLLLKVAFSCSNYQNFASFELWTVMIIDFDYGLDSLLEKLPIDVLLVSVLISHFHLIVLCS